MHFLAKLSLIGLAISVCGDARAADYVLTIGGGYSPSGNQASLENNVLYFQRVLEESKLDVAGNDIYFSDGTADGRDLQAWPPNRLSEP